MSEKLKPCPFCGGEGRVWKTLRGTYVECINCNTQTKLVDTPELAVKWWNTRDLTPYQKYAKELYDGLEYMLNITSDVLEAISPLFYDLQSNLKDELKQYQALIDKIESEVAARHEF